MIAEFVNTFSNILFVAIPATEMRLLRSCGNKQKLGFFGIWISIMFIGLSSAYFHATLSLLGQFLDELGILWLYCAAFWIFYPKKMFPKILIGNRKRLGLFCLAVAVFGTGLSIVNPIWNAFALMSLCIPSVIVLALKIAASGNPRVKRLGLVVWVVWSLALICWINDKVFCDVWRRIGFPYLHALWHAFMAVTCCFGCVLFSYFRMKEDFPDGKTVLMFWPNDEWVFGLPYAVLKEKDEE